LNAREIGDNEKPKGKKRNTEGGKKKKENRIK